MVFTNCTISEFSKYNNLISFHVHMYVVHRTQKDTLQIQLDNRTGSAELYLHPLMKHNSSDFALNKMCHMNSTVYSDVWNIIDTHTCIDCVTHFQLLQNLQI